MVAERALVQSPTRAGGAHPATNKFRAATANIYLALAAAAAACSIATVRASAAAARGAAGI